MKKRISCILIIMVMLCVVATGCQNGDNSESNNTEKNQVEENQETTEKEDLENSEEKIEEPEESEEAITNEQVAIPAYFSNDDATAFVSEEVQIDKLLPENVLQAIISKGEVPADVQILGFEAVTVDGKNSIELDLNSAFSTYIMSMGSTGEYYAIGSICNTFLDAYDYEQIKITVEGNVLESGHAEYPGYMTMFE